MAKKHLDTKMFNDICKNELKKNATVKYSCGDYDVEIIVKPYSTMQEKQDIAEVVWGCYGDGFNVSVDTPAFRLMVLYTYCDNLKIDIGKGLTHYYDLVMHTGLYDAVISEIDKSDFSELMDVVWEYKNEMQDRQHVSNVDKMLASLLDTINNKLAGLNIDELLSNIQEIAKSAEDGNIVEKVLEHYNASAAEVDDDGNNNGRPEEGNTEED